jgi:UDP-glucose 4-epimerase
MKIFLTGGTGFIGSWVVKALLENTDHHLVLSARNIHKVPSYHQNPRITLIQADLSDHKALQTGLQGCDALIHIALGWGETPLTMLKNDTQTSVFLMEAALNAGLKKVITTSSTAAMGQMRPIMDESTCTRPLDLYGATKAATEAYLLALAHQSTCQLNVVRPGYTFGNPAFKDSFTQPDRRFHNIVQQAIANQPITVIKHDGTQFIHAADLAKIYLGILNSDCSGEIFLGLAPSFVTWHHIAQMAVEYCASSSEIIQQDLGWSSTPMTFDVSKIKTFFGISADPHPGILDHIAYLSHQLQKDV